MQLPPVLTDYQRNILQKLWQQDIHEGFAFEASEWSDMHFQNIVLTHVVRQNEPQFIESLNHIRRGNTAALAGLCKLCTANPLNDAIYICSTNSEAAEFNHNSMDKLDTEEHYFTADVIGKVSANDKAADDEICLKVGARVMTLVNNPEGYYKTVPWAMSLILWMKE